MPYSSISELPAEVRGRYSTKQLRAFRSAFNNALGRGRSEEQAFRVAHSAAQRVSEKAHRSAEELAAEAVERVRQRRPVVEPEPEVVPEPAWDFSTNVQAQPGERLLPARAFLTEANGRTILTAPADMPEADDLEKAWTPNPHFLWLHGRFVGGEEANRNGALWTTGDLEMGEPTVKHGPLNWLHEEHKIVGAIADAQLVQPTLANVGQPEAASDQQPYIAAASVVWKFLWPLESQVIEQASEQQRLWYSMECVSKEVACVDHECGSWPYMDVMRQRADVCDHVRLKQGTRRFVDPIFTGGAIIVPPVRPGWPDAHASLMRQAAARAEQAFDQAGRPPVEAAEWERIMAIVLAFAGVEALNER